MTENHPTQGLVTWTYDSARHRLSQTDKRGQLSCAYDAADQLVSIYGPSGLEGYTFDANGNMLVVQPPTGAPTTYTWDASDRLTGIALPNGARCTYTYRYDGKRNSAQTASGTEVMIWDENGQLLAVVGSGGGNTHLAVHGPTFARQVGQGRVRAATCRRGLLRRAS